MEFKKCRQVEEGRKRGREGGREKSQVVTPHRAFTERKSGGRREGEKEGGRERGREGGREGKRERRTFPCKKIGCHGSSHGPKS
jgi:hypothetical protein